MLCTGRDQINIEPMKTADTQTNALAEAEASGYAKGLEAAERMGRALGAVVERLERVTDGVSQKGVGELCRALDTIRALAASPSTPAPATDPPEEVRERVARAICEAVNKVTEDECEPTPWEELDAEQMRREQRIDDGE